MKTPHRCMRNHSGNVREPTILVCCFFFFLLVVVLGNVSLSEAQIYKWVDTNGVEHFGQAPPQGAGKATTIEATLPTPSQQTEFDRPQERPEKTQRSERKPPVPTQERAPVVNQQLSAEMYSTSWCGYCRKAREYFRARGVQLTEYDIEADPIAAERKRQIDTRPGVPLVVINGQLIHGFVPALYEQALAGRP